MLKRVALCVACVLAGSAAAQERTPPGPRIAADGKVTFTLKAPGGRQVTLRGNWPGGSAGTATPMARDDTGAWSATVGPILPGVWTYSFDVDGLRVADSQNVHTDGARSSTLLVPGSASYDYEMHDVPHGTVAAIWYPARTLGLPAKRAFIYTPPGYEAGRERYPVLYLTANNEDSWATTGRATNILDNLIASGKAKPMIVVMPGTVPDAAASPQTIDEPLPSMIGRPSRFDKALNPHGLMQTLPPYLDGGTSIARDVVPFVDARYRTVADRDHRAIVGLSASGAAAFYAAMTNTGTFAWIGGFSAGWPSLPGAWESVAEPSDAATRFPDVEGRPDIRQNVDVAAVARMLPAMNAAAAFRLVALYVGANDPLVEADRRIRRLLDERGIRYASVEAPKQVHEWRFWTWCLDDFAPKLFRPTP